MLWLRWVGFLLLTGVGAPVAAVTLGAAAVLSGVSTVLEVATDPEVRRKMAQTVTWVKKQVPRVMQRTQQAVQKAVQTAQQTLHTIGAAVTRWTQQANRWLGTLFGGG